MEKPKEAILLTLVNPFAGGLLLSGEKGTGKSTLVRSARELLADAPWVEVPISITEDRLFGSIDTEEAIRSGHKKLLPGLIDEADQGLLYMDDVNLLRDDLLSAVLNIREAGGYRLERDGLNPISRAVESLRPHELAAVFFDLLVRQTAEALTAAITDKRGADNDVIDLMVLVVQCAVQGKTVNFAFLIADNTDLFLKGIDRLYVPLHYSLHGFETALDLCRLCHSVGLQQDDPDLIFAHLSALLSFVFVIGMPRRIHRQSL